MEKLKIGDRVRCIKNTELGHVIVGMKGTFREYFQNSDIPYGIKWDTPINGYNLNNSCPYGKRWFVGREYIEKITGSGETISQPKTKMKFVIKNEKEKDEVELYLEKDGDDVLLRSNGWNLMRFTDGKFLRCTSIPSDIGIEVDGKGRIKEEDNE